MTTGFLIYSGTLNLEVVKVLYNHYTRPSTANDYTSLLEPSRSKWHPIDHLIAEANTTFNTLLLSRSTTLGDAAARYRLRRGRHPPPGFDKWFEYAQNHSAVIVEDFFDRIEHDIRPFWALNATVLAERAATWHHRVRVRSGNTTMEGDVTGRVPWLLLWKDLVQEAGEWLPDLDMPINYMDEPRLLVPFEEVTRLVEEAERTRRITPVNMTKTAYDAPVRADTNDSKPYDPEWFHAPTKYWDYTRRACPPDSPAQNYSSIADFSGPLPFPAEPWQPSYLQDGYVRNFTAASDPCLQPHLRGLHGTFIDPISMSTATELIPLFGGSKLPVNNEILIPAAMYLPTDEFYYGGDDHGPPWLNKSDVIIWRGVASGGRATADKWRGFQRHRLVQMLNGTTVAAAEKNGTAPPTFDLPPLSAYDFPRRREGRIGEWLAEKADVGFNNLLCGDDCGHVEPYFREVEGMKMKEQFAFKFMPDADGNSFSGRFRGLLMSTSLPLKATVYAEWHDDRLKPWLHFAPMENTYRDLYGLLDYFIRDKKGDAAAAFIAETGQRWASSVLRREDMLLYTWRVLLEFARVCDAEREVLGFVDDLL